MLDDDGQSGNICTWLDEAGYQCRHITDSDAFIGFIKQNRVDLIIQTCDLPGRRGTEALDWIRENQPVPVIVIGQKDDEECIVTALEHGADDYLARPVRQRELLARVKALLRRTRAYPHRSKVKHIGPFTVDESSRTIHKDGIKVAMTQKEYALAYYLFDNIGHLLSRRSILEHVWGHTSILNTRTVDTHISRIRKKLELVPEQGWHLSAVYQSGYRLERI